VLPGSPMSHGICKISRHIASVGRASVGNAVRPRVLRYRFSACLSLVSCFCLVTSNSSAAGRVLPDCQQDPCRRWPIGVSFRCFVNPSRTILVGREIRTDDLKQIVQMRDR
jgi:hypothetical protein